MTRGLAQPFRLNSQFGVVPLHSTPSQPRLTAQAPARLHAAWGHQPFAAAGRGREGNHIALRLGRTRSTTLDPRTKFLVTTSTGLPSLIVTGGERAQINCTLSDAPSFCKKPERLSH